MTIDKLKIGESKKIVNIKGEGKLKHRLLEMGLVPNTPITLIKKAPFGDPIEITIRGYELSLRLDEAKNVEVE